jgi:hypothetical protein
MGNLVIKYKSWKMNMVQNNEKDDPRYSQVGEYI